MTDLERSEPLQDGASSFDLARESAGALPFLCKLLICFLLVDGVERGVELIAWWVGGRSVPLGLFPPNVPALSLWVCVNFLLALLLGLQTSWGRIWTQVIFGIHILYIGQCVVVNNPEVWIYMSSGGRFRLLLTLAVDLLAIGYLFSGQARQALSR